MEEYGDQIGEEDKMQIQTDLNALKEAIKEEMEMADPLDMLDRAAALAEELADMGEDRAVEIVAILNRLHSSLADTM